MLKRCTRTFLTSICVQIFRVDDLPIESGMLTDALDNAQKKVEAYFFNMRKQLWEYDQARSLTRTQACSVRVAFTVSTVNQRCKGCAAQSSCSLLWSTLLVVW